MAGVYPFYHSLIDKLAAKVITRIATDGMSMEDAIKEAINLADLDKKETLHLCMTLADYGLVYNGEPKDYFYTSGDMGKDFPNGEQGYVVYATKKTDKNARLFEAIHQWKEAGFTNEQILDINPELEDILSIVDHYQNKYVDVMNQHEPMQMAAGLISSRTIKAQAVDVEKPTPENINQALEGEEAPAAPAAEAPAEEMVEETPQAGPSDDETVFEDEVGGAEPTGGATVTISPSPEELNEKLQKAPKWSVDSILSIEKAKAYYDNLKKEMEEVVLNDKISMGEELMKQYDEARAAIEEQVNKIDDAQKETKKLEEKKDDIEEEFQAPGPEAAGEQPTESLIAEEEGFEPTPEPGAAPAPAPAAK
jgi:hypothetical protein